MPFSFVESEIKKEKQRKEKEKKRREMNDKAKATRNEKNFLITELLIA